uniref:perilipin-3-like isoform X2 n=1 Tax=Myxine glutinosa TaxID=7769 RepID=UPI00358DE921
MAVEVQTVGTKNVFQRLSSLPLFSSAADELVQAYRCGKESRPVLLSFGNMVEQGVTGVAVITSSGIEPIARILHPQIKFVDELACRGLDLVEEKVPLLHQPANKVLGDVKKNLQIAQKQMGVFLDWSKSQVGVGMERSKQAMLDGTDSLLKTKFGQVVLSGADSMLSQVDGYLPRDQPEGESPDEKVVMRSDSSLDLYRRLIAVSSKAGREVFKKSSSGIQRVAETGRAGLTSVLESFNALCDSVVKKTPVNQVIDALHQDQDSDRSGDVCKSSTGAGTLGKPSK